MGIFKKTAVKKEPQKKKFFTISTDRFDDIFVNEDEEAIAVFARSDNTFRLQKISDMRLYSKCVDTLKQFYPDGVYER